jgi:ion channel-forming bestrophin family protein
MIVTQRISLAKLISFTWPRLLLLLAFTALACVSMEAAPRELLQALSYAAGFLGTALAFLIGFRNNAAYGRWWEGHRIWSKLKYDSRSFALMVTGLIDGGDSSAAVRTDLIHRQIAFAWWLNRYLRKLEPGSELDGLLTAEEKAAAASRQTPPLALLENQASSLRQLANAGLIDSYRHVRFSQLIQDFNEALSSSERLKKTPFPRQYTWFVNYTLVVFLLVLPLSLAGHLGYWAIPFSLVIGYAYILLEYVGRHIENPFENAVNDVPMDYIARTIEIDLKELLGEVDLPEPIQPQGKGYLY